MHLHQIVLGFVFFASCRAQEDNTIEKKKSFDKECSTTYSPTCLKLDIVQWVDKLGSSEEFSVFPGVKVVRDEVAPENTNSEIVAELAREFPNDPEARIDAFLTKKVAGYLKSHSLKVNLFDEKSAEEFATARKGGLGGGKGDKKGGGLGMLLAAGAMMKGTLMALALGALAALAGKALMAGLASLMLSSIIGLKSLSGGQKSTTYEIVSKPIYSHANTHSSSHEESHHGGYGHSSYGRSFNVPLPLELQPAYKP